MILNTIFVISGLLAGALIVAKVLEGKRKNKPMLLRFVSLSDEWVRHFSHELAHRYAELKEKIHFLVSKQLPLHTKNLVNKTQATIKEKAGQYIVDIRGSRFLKKSDGISEFFKNLSERQNGRIDDEFQAYEGDDVESKG